MERKYRYALRNQEKIKEAFGEEYFKNHIIASLDAFFSKPFCLYDEKVRSRQFYEGKYESLLINDIADKDDMQLFACLTQDFKYDVIRLAYIKRVKGLLYI